jgi:peptidoglycan hydrolase-like protein with peptidoglycan-binding domain
LKQRSHVKPAELLMKLKVIVPVLCLALSVAAFSDELVKSAQTELKSQGFFYGEVTGVNSPETVAAVKRFQIRNGLEVSGTLTKETLDALGVSGDSPVTEPEKRAPTLKTPERRAEPIERATPSPSRKPPPVDLRRNPTQQDSDREFLKRTPGPDSEPAPDTVPPATGGGGYAQLFARTPYATAPLEVQQTTLKRAQKFLRELGFYREPINGEPGPATEEALLGYQRFIRLPLTGHLDLETLTAMRLLPGRGGFPVRPGGSRPLRGVLID